MNDRLPMIAAAACLLLTLACNDASNSRDARRGDSAAMAMDSTHGRVAEIGNTGNAQVTGITISKSGRTFLCFPFWSPDHGVSVAELMSDGTLHPYPNDAWNRWNGAPASAGSHLVCVQSVWVDPDDFLWILDPASPMMKGVVPGGAKLLKVDLKNDSVIQTIRFDATVAPARSYLNDVRIDIPNHYAYLTESGMGAIVVTDLATGRSRRLLAQHPSTKAEDGVVPKIEGKELRDTTGQVPKINADGIAFDQSNGYLYYKALIGRTLYRIKSDKLRDPAAGDQALAAAVENLGATVVCDGMIMDGAGNLYLTSIEENGVRRRSPDGTLTLVAADSALKWPDTFAFAPDGSLRVTASMIHLGPNYNQGADRRVMPYKLFRVDLR